MDSNPVNLTADDIAGMLRSGQGIRVHHPVTDGMSDAATMAGSGGSGQLPHPDELLHGLHTWTESWAKPALTERVEHTQTEPPPVQEFGNIAEHWNHIWHDPSKGIVGKLYESTLGFPAHELARGLSYWTQTPYHEDLRDQIMEMAAPRNPEKNLLGTYGASFLAETAGFAADPLTYLTAGAGPLAKEAIGVLKEAPELGRGAREAAEFAHGLRLGENAGLRRAGEWTPELLRQRAVPVMVQRSMASEELSLADRMATLRHTLAGTPGDAQAATELQTVKNQYNTLQATKAAAFGTHKGVYDQMLEQGRQLAKPYHEEAVRLPASAMDATQPIDNRIKDLAYHHASVEKGVLAQLPQVRFAGYRPFGLNIRNPFDVVGRGLQKMMGSWEDIPQLNEAVSKFPLAQSAVKYLGLKPEDPLGHVERMLAYRQMGPGVRRSLLSTPQEMGKWLVRELDHFSPADRPEVFQHVKDLYKGLADLKQIPGVASHGTSPAEMAIGLKSLEAWEQDPKFVAKWLNPAMQGPARAGTYAEAATQEYLDHINKLKGVFDQHLQDLQKQLAGGASADDVAATLGKIHAAANSIPRADIENFANSYLRFTQSRVPFEHAVAHNLALSNMGKAARDMADTAHSYLRSLDKYMQWDKVGAHMDGIDLLGRVDPKLWASTLQEMALKRGGAPNAGAVAQYLGLPGQAAQALPSWVTDAKNAIKQSLTQRAAKAGFDPQPAFTFIDSLSEQGLNDFAHVMADTAKNTNRTLLRSKLLDESTHRFRDLLLGANRLERNVVQKLALPWEESWGYYQSQFHPNALGKLYNAKVVPHINGMRQRILRFSGIAPRVVDALLEFDGGYLYNKRQALRRGVTDFHNTELRGILQKHGLAGTQQELADVSKAYGRVKAYEGGLTSPNPVVQQIAQEAKAEGRAALKKLVGDDAKVDSLLDTIQQHVKAAHLDPLFESERRSGHAMVYRQDYLPLSLLGSHNDKEAFYDALGHHGLDALAEGKPLATEFFAPALKREFDSAAGLEAAIKQVNEKRVAQNLGALNLKVDSNLTSLLTNRHYASLNTQASLKLISELQALLPQNVMPIRKLSDVPGELGRLIKRTGLPWRDMGDLIPAMKGWAVDQHLYDFLKTFSRGAYEPSGVEGIFNGLTSWAQKFAHWAKFINTSSSLMHLKNMMPNFIIGGGSLVGLKDTLADMFERAGKEYGGRPLRENLLSPISPLAHAAEADPHYEMAIRTGAIPYSGHEFELPIHDLVNLHTSPASLSRGAMRWLTKGQGPFQQLIFDVMDRAMRLTMYKQGLKMGMTPRATADWVNRAMIDYSLKHLHPDARRFAYAISPFAAWHIGNWALHGSNIVENPMWYGMFYHGANEINHQYSGLSPSQLEQNRLLASALATPFTAPGTGFRFWVTPQLPFQNIVDLYKQEVEEPTAPAKAFNLGHYFMNRMWDWQKGIAGLADPSGRKRLEQEGMADWLLGKGGQSGVLGEELWGLQGLRRLPDIWHALWDPKQWNSGQLGTGLGYAGVNLFMRTMPITPAGREAP